VLKDVVEVRPSGTHRLLGRFEDGVEGEVDIAELIRCEGVFAPLADRAAFEQVSLHPELKVVCWPNGADLDPDVLYARVAGTGVPSFEKRSVTPR
jgi:hypothetical protein